MNSFFNPPYHTWKAAALGLLLFYTVVGVGNRLVSTGPEDLYPFFSWSLFAKVPDRVQNDAVLEVKELNGQLISPPQPIEKSRVFNPNRSFFAFTLTVRSLAGAISQNRSDLIPGLRKDLESYFLPTQSLTYGLVSIKFDPIERYKSGQFIARKEVANFMVGRY